MSSESNGELGKLTLFTFLISTVNVPYPLGSATSDATLTSLIPTLTSTFSEFP